MQWFANLKTRSKLFFGFGVMLAILGIVIMVSFQGISRIRENEKMLFEENYVSAMEIRQIRINQRQIRITAFQMLMTKDKQKLKELSDEGDGLDRDNRELLAKLKEREKDNTLLIGKLSEYDKQFTAFAETRTNEVVPPILEGNTEAATQVLMTTQAERSKVIGALGLELDQILADEAASSIVESNRIKNESLGLFLLAGLFAIAMAIVITLMLNRLIAAPFATVATIAGKVATGDLTVEVEAGKRSDEVGILQQAMKSMVENLRGFNRELREGLGILASSSTEILATVSQVAAGASETATSVSETSTTAEEVKQTAHLSYQKAKNVQESAQKAASVSETGGKAVNGTIDGINHIREQMEAIAESVVWLSEQSQTIGEIIAMVDDLAQQSNLLAVNAAIEATRAGEYGKGFAVVAQEMKSLAEQSRQATTQVRTILMEVQKATSTAVMATEQGTKAVAAGVKQAGEAGESIKALTSTISDSVQAATQIAASSQQQLIGMDQIASALTNINQATTQNMAGTKQLEQSAQSLQKLGERLKSMVERQQVEA